MSVSGRATAAFLAFCLMSASACSGEDGASTAGKAADDAVELGEVDESGGTLTSDTFTIIIPPGAVPAGETVTVLQVPTRSDDQELFGTGVEVEHSSPLLEAAQVRWDISALNDGQRSALTLVRWDDELDLWAIDDAAQMARFEIEGNELVASLAEWSIWNWSTLANMGQTVGEVTGSRVNAPSCKGDLPDWVDGVVDPDEGTNAAAIRVCFEADKDEVVTIRVVNNRTFTQRIEIVDPGHTFAWTWPGKPSYGLDGILNTAAHSVFDSPTSFLVPPLQEVAVGIGRPDGGTSQVIGFESDVDAVTVMRDVVGFMLGEIPVDVSESPVLEIFATMLIECGGRSALEQPDGVELSAMAATIVGVVADCAGMITDSLHPTELTDQFDAKIRAARPDAKRLATSKRAINQVSNALKVFKLAKVAFYLSDQLQNAYIGNLGFLVRGRGRSQSVGSWSPVCNNTSTDSNLLYKNIALQDQFSDKSRDLWEFEGWAAAAAAVVQPLAACDPAYRAELAAMMPGDWGDPIAAQVVADEILKLGGGTSGAGAEGTASDVGVSSDGRTFTLPYIHPQLGPVTITVDAGDERPGDKPAPSVRAIQNSTGNTVFEWVSVDGYDTFGLWGLSPDDGVDSPVDGRGHVFLKWNPGRFDGVSVLVPVPTGFDSIGTLNDSFGDYYFAGPVDVDGDGLYEVDQGFQICEPTCADGIYYSHIWPWDGTRYSGPSDQPDDDAGYVESAGFNVAAAESFFRDYLVTAGAREYVEAWDMLNSGYQGKYGGFDRFTGFWDTISVVGLDDMDSVQHDDGSVTVTATVWFDVVGKDRQTEVVEVDLDTSVGSPLITDYRFIRTA